MKFELLDKWFSASKDWHIAVSVFVFVVGSVLQWFKHLDPTFVGFSATVLGAVVGHAFSPAQKEQQIGGPNAGQ